MEENWKHGKFSVYTFKGHNDWVRCLQFEGNNLISGSADKTVKIWNMDSRECYATLIGHSRCINCLSYDKNMLASACTSVKVSLGSVSGAFFVDAVDMEFKRHRFGGRAPLQSYFARSRGTSTLYCTLHLTISRIAYGAFK